MNNKSHIYNISTDTESSEPLKKYSLKSVRKRFKAEKQNYIAHLKTQEFKIQEIKTKKKLDEAKSELISIERNQRQLHSPTSDSSDTPVIVPKRRKKSKTPLRVIGVMSVAIVGAMGFMAYRYFFDQSATEKTDSILVNNNNNSAESLILTTATTVPTTETTTVTTTTTSTTTTTTTTTSTTTTTQTTVSSTTTETTTTTTVSTSTTAIVSADERIDRLEGQIITKGDNISGYTSDYVVDGGDCSYVTKKLTNGLHVTARSIFTSYSVTWYELYDTDSGDYYGWVDEEYIYFYPSEPAEIVPVSNMKGQINCHGVTVAGFPTDYVSEFKEFSKKNLVRKSLGDQWHVTAKNKCESYNVTWYELWDTDDGDYYGWVDEYYIDFY
ncbi:MAG: hypothetical protein NC177_05585 [Ruminococcus flavefaciens]|nr:hypothetical protein [Ruminococcus flavefaciens]